MRTLAIAIGALIVARSELKLTASEALAHGLPVVSLLLLIVVVVWLAGGESELLASRHRLKNFQH